MEKQDLHIRLDGSVAQILRKKSKQQNKSMSEYVAEAIQSKAGQAPLRDEIRNIQAQLDKIEGDLLALLDIAGR